MVGQPAQPFVQLSESDVKPGKLTFNWNPPVVNCSALHYIVNSTGCGNCTYGFRTSSPSITCSVHTTFVDLLLEVLFAVITAALSVIKLMFY